MNQSEVEVLITIAKNAGEILKKYFKKDLKIDYKIDKSHKTIADIESNDYIVTELKKNFPKATIVSEEGEQTISENYFTVDPLGGTANFIQKNSRFDIMIALVKNYSPEFGIVYNPITEVLYIGGKNYQSKIITDKNEKLLKINNNISKDNDIMLVNANIFEKFQDLYVYLPELKLIKSNEISNNYRSFINIAEQESNLRINLLSGGWIWDIAATHAILEGAGGVVKDLKGKNLNYDDVKLNQSSIGADSLERLNRVIKEFSAN